MIRLADTSGKEKCKLKHELEHQKESCWLTMSLSEFSVSNLYQIERVRQHIQDATPPVQLLTLD